MKCLVRLTVLLLSLVLGASGQEIKSVQGRIAGLEYPQFTLINFKVRLEKDTAYYVQWNGVKNPTPLRPELLREEQEVETKGLLDIKTSTLHAQSVTFLLKQDFICELGGTAMIQQTPHLAKGPNGWAGSVHADARELIVDSSTQLKFLPESHDQNFANVSTNMFVAYVGKIMLDGSIHLDRAAFWNNEVDPDELKMRQRDEPVFAAADASHKVTATLTMGGGRPMTLAGSAELQRRVSAIGLTLVPDYQKSLAADDPTKVNFRFYVVHDKRKMILDAMNGTILVPDAVLNSVHNEAQLAALLSLAIAQVIEKQEYQSRHRRRFQQIGGWLLTGVSAVPTPLSLLALPAQIANGTTYRKYLLAMSEQANRVGLEYTIAAGYDPREAPAAWKLTLQKHPEKSEKQTEIGEFVQTELDTTYWKTDFNGLRVGAEDFREWSKELN